MARPNPIRTIMQAPLPSLTYQRRKLYRPDTDEVEYLYRKINYYVFDNQLKKPDIRLGTIKKCWGVCEWETVKQPSGSYCNIRLSDKWFCPQWFVNTLAHEMAHQWQWDIYRFQHAERSGKPIYELSGAHGPSFFVWRERFNEYDLTLKTSYGQRRWFNYQDFKKC